MKLKSAEELFWNYATEYYRTETDKNYTMAINLDDFIQAINSDRGQVREMIEKVKEKHCLDKWFGKDEVADILTGIINNLNTKEE